MRCLQFPVRSARTFCRDTSVPVLRCTFSPLALVLRLRTLPRYHYAHHPLHCRIPTTLRSCCHWICGPPLPRFLRHACRTCLPPRLFSSSRATHAPLPPRHHCCLSDARGTTLHTLPAARAFLHAPCLLHRTYTAGSPRATLRARALLLVLHRADHDGRCAMPPAVCCLSQHAPHCLAPSPAVGVVLYLTVLLPPRAVRAACRLPHYLTRPLAHFAARLSPHLVTTTIPGSIVVLTRVSLQHQLLFVLPRGLPVQPSPAPWFALRTALALLLFYHLYPPKITYTAHAFLPGSAYILVVPGCPIPVTLVTRFGVRFLRLPITVALNHTLVPLAHFALPCAPIPHG